MQFVLCIIQSAILTLSYVGVAIVYGNELPETGILTNYPMVEFYISIFLLMYAADAMGIMISCLVKKEEAANVLAPYILIVQLIFSGILFAMEGMADYISYVMISRWGMEALGSIAYRMGGIVWIHCSIFTGWKYFASPSFQGYERLKKFSG